MGSDFNERTTKPCLPYRHNRQTRLSRFPKLQSRTRVTRPDNNHKLFHINDLTALASLCIPS